MIEGSGNETARTESVRTEDYREVAGCACFHVRRAARLVTQDFDDALSAVGLKATQYTVLCALAGPWKRPPSLVVLADYLLVEPSALSRNVAVLVKRGLLVLEPGEDRRERGVRLTDEGRRLFREGFPQWKRAQEATKERLGTEAFDRSLEAVKALAKPEPRKVESGA